MINKSTLRENQMTEIINLKFIDLLSSNYIYALLHENHKYCRDDYFILSF